MTVDWSRDNAQKAGPGYEVKIHVTLQPNQRVECQSASKTLIELCVLNTVIFVMS